MPLRYFIFKFTVDIGAVLKSGLVLRNSAGANLAPLAVTVGQTTFMTFPFVITFERITKVDVGQKFEVKSFLVIENYLKAKRVDNFYRVDNSIKFKKGFFGLNTNPFSSIDKGEFTVTPNSQGFTLTYKFYILRQIIITTIMSIVAGFASGQLSIGLIGFTVLTIGNYLISIVRQLGVFNDIFFDINKT